MFDQSFSYASATSIPPSLSTDTAINILHDFETVIKLSPDCRGCKRIPPPKNGYTNGAGKGAKMEFYEVEDDLPFIPKRLWHGGVKYTADFLPVEDGCDITVHAPAGFTSTNHWRILRDQAPMNDSEVHQEESSGDQELELERTTSRLEQLELQRTASKHDSHVGDGGAGWYVQIISDAKCPRTFASFVKGFLKNSHGQLERAFVDKLRESQEQRKKRRPTLGRRRSTEF